MNFSEALEKLEASNEFKKFKQEHLEIYLCAGFFVLDFETQNNTHQLDFQLPDNKIAAFSINEYNTEINFKIEESMKKEKLSKLQDKINIEIQDLKKICEDELEKKKMSKGIKKIIAVLQTHENKQIWNLTCMLESFGMLRVHINTSNGEILKSEKLNLFDLVKKG